MAQALCIIPVLLFLYVASVQGKDGAIRYIVYAFIAGAVGALLGMAGTVGEIAGGLIGIAAYFGYPAILFKQRVAVNGSTEQKFWRWLMRRSRTISDVSIVAQGHPSPTPLGEIPWKESIIDSLPEGVAARIRWDDTPRDCFLAPLPPQSIAVRAEDRERLTSHGSAHFEDAAVLEARDFFREGGIILGKVGIVRTDTRTVTETVPYARSSALDVRVELKDSTRFRSRKEEIFTRVPVVEHEMRTVTVQQTVERIEESYLYLQSEGHMTVIAPPGAGKTAGVIIPNVLKYSGSVFVTDMKGEIHAVTAAHRKGDVYVIDPFGRTAATRRAGINLLSYIGHEFFSEDCDAIAASLLPMPARTDDQYWILGAREIVSGLIAHVLLSDDLPAEKKHIGQVRRWLTAPPEALQALFQEMGASISEHVAQAANSYLSAPEKTRGSMLKQAQVSTAFLKSPKIVQALSAGLPVEEETGEALDVCDLRRMGTDHLTVYLSVPDKYMSSHGPFVRLVTEALLLSIDHSRRPAKKPLLLLDEFCNMGKMEMIAQRMSNSRELAHIVLIAQSVGQIKALYGEEVYHTIMDCSPAQMFIAPADFETQKEVSERLGKETRRATTQQRGRSQAAGQTVGTGTTTGTSTTTGTTEGWSMGTNSGVNVGGKVSGSGGQSSSQSVSQSRSQSESSSTSESQSVSETRTESETVAEQLYSHHLMTPDEIAAMPRDAAIILVAGREVRPIKARRIQYFAEATFAGGFSPNPFYT